MRRLVLLRQRRGKRECNFQAGDRFAKLWWHGMVHSENSEIKGWLL